MKSALRKILIVVGLFLLAFLAYFMYDRLRQRSFEEKLAEIVHFEDSRVFDDRLRNYLTDDSLRIRQKATLAIGRIGASGSGQTLLELVRTEPIDVAATAAFALGLTGQKEVAAPLLDLAFDAPSKVGAMAVTSAGKLIDSSMTQEISQLTGFLDHPAPEVREAACLALFRAGAKDKGAELIDFLADEPDEVVQVSALYALARLGVASAESIYAEFLADADPFARCLAVRGLGAVGSKEAVHYLSIALNDGDKKVVSQAISSLATKKYPEAQKHLSARLYREQDELLICDIIEGLRRQENALALDAVVEKLRVPESENVKISAIKYLAWAQKGRAVAMIDSMSIDAAPRLAAAAAEAYGIINDVNIVPRLAMLFKDDRAVVRAAALEGLLQFDASNRDLYLKQALSDSSFAISVAAVEEIKKWGLVEYLPQLRALSEMKEAVVADVRRALVEACEPFVTPPQNDSNAMRLLINGILDSDYIVRREAAAVYKRALGEDRTKMVPPAVTRYDEGQIAQAIKKYHVNPRAQVMTNKGDFEFELLFDIAPLTVMNFIDLTEKGFYENLTFHRVVSNFVVQGGDPEGTGWGGPGYNIRCEYSSEPYRRGSVGIATSGKDTGGSQFFVTVSPQPHLDGRYTLFGQITQGMEVVDKIVPGDIIKRVTIKQGDEI